MLCLIKILIVFFSFCMHLFRTHTYIKMYRTQFLLVLFVAYGFEMIITLPQGAPESACHTLLPFHRGIRPSSSRPPYRIVPHNVAVNQGQVLRIEIEPQFPELSFGGFMIQARNVRPPYQVVSVCNQHYDSFKFLISKAEKKKNKPSI